MATRRGGLIVAAALAALCLGTGATEASLASEHKSLGTENDRLRAFEGRFAYRGAPVDILAHQGGLYAIIEDSAYPLLASGGDIFRNGAGQPVEFLRDPSGQVVAVREGQDRFEKLAGQVSAASRALLIPRGTGPYRYQQPEPVGDGLAVGTLGRGRLDPQLASLAVEGVANGRYPNVHAILVHHRGRLVLEEYFHGFDRARPHQMRSLTKGVIAMVAGAAIDRGLVSIEDAALVDLVPAPASLSAVHRAVTLSDLLAMRSRLSCDDERASAAVNNDTLYGREDWVGAFLAAPARAASDPPAAYCSAGMLVAGRFLEVRARSAISDFARQTLFRPLGIADDDWSWPFVLGSAGGGEFGQVRLRPRDMMKLGVTILQNGQFNGRQVLTRSWITAMTTRHSTIDGDAYGYGLWFRDYRVNTAEGPRTVSTIMMSGNGGQKIYVVPSLDLVVVATGGSYNQGNAPINAMMTEVILPAALQAGGAAGGRP